MIPVAHLKVVDAFLKAETECYLWRADGCEMIRQSLLFLSWRNKILDHESRIGRNVHLVSMSNLGEAVRTLTVPHKFYKWDGPDYFIHFGTTPRDGVTIQQEPFSCFEDMTKGPGH